ncbi:hypothetical protein [Methanobrevibacter sp.]|uniref:hypothetical protein n=1 Tax=Methanobrevibacter sp. TaxID=66852 RepID=UPI0025E1AD09|nr:hypothetical protein [Methanobrevibacter sp.]MBQ2832248.1 hypothetical protein [Methanobrevibacter sp.]
MTNSKKNPVNVDLDFDHTETKELEQQLLSGKITFKEWERNLHKKLDKLLDN